MGILLCKDQIHEFYQAFSVQSESLSHIGLPKFGNNGM